MSRKLSYTRLTGLTAALVAAGLISSPLALAHTQKNAVAAAVQNSMGLSEHSSGATNRANMAGNSLQNATGTINVNEMSGNDNKQVNATVISTGDGTFTWSTTASLVFQNMFGVSFGQQYTTNSATIGDHDLQGATGSISVNIGAGDANQQANAIAVTKAHLAHHTHQGALVDQDLSYSGSSGDDAVMGNRNTSSVGGSALAGASGRISVNVVSGDANQQGNATTVHRGMSSHSERVSSLVDQDSSYNQVGDQEPWPWGEDWNSDPVNTNRATLGGSALERANGKIAVNVASGRLNQQGNATDVNTGATSKHRRSHSTAMVDQDSSHNGTTIGYTHGFSEYYDNYNDLAANEGRINNDNGASVSGSALQGATGQIGVNVAAGQLNQQANATTINTSVNPHRVHSGSAASLVFQSSSNNGFTAGPRSEGESLITGIPNPEIQGTNRASIGGSALQNAGGEIGVNVAAGLNNQQANATVVNRSWVPNWDSSFALVDQDAWMNDQPMVYEAGTLKTSANNSASLSGSALQGASGEISANVAAGRLNQQANAVAVSNQATKGTATIGLVFQDEHSGPEVSDSGSNSASLGGSVLQGASGQISVNAAAGQNNQQANATTVSRANDDFVFGQAAVSVQNQGGVSTKDSGSNSASMSGTVLKGASGNISVNETAGTANQQANSVEVVRASTLSGVSGSLAVQNQYCSSATNMGTNTVSMSGNVLQNASGNIGVNMSAGSGNMQSNVMAIATH